VRRLQIWNLQQSGKSKATRYGENRKGDLVDLPICREEVQPRRLHKESKPLESAGRVIEEIRRLMLRSAVEFSSKEKLSGRKPTIAAGKKQHHNIARQWSRWTTLENCLGSRWISKSLEIS
jgi:hypothetical protein